VAIEELWDLNYPNFANSQYVAAQDKYPEIADPAGKDGVDPKLLCLGPAAQLTC
jgi:hypothetical protein